MPDEVEHCAREFKTALHLIVTQPQTSFHTWGARGNTPCRGSGGLAPAVSCGIKRKKERKENRERKRGKV